MTAQDYVDELLRTVEEVGRELASIDDEMAGRKPSATAWSAKEIVGHLIDSAANNHQRFVRARWQEDLVFPGYAQDGWVEAQDYQHAPWLELISLWQQYNRHLARVMRATPPEVRYRRHARHNLHEIAWKTVPAVEAATLEYFMADYVGHLAHHVSQIRRLLDAARTT